jgi:NTE family protein
MASAETSVSAKTDSVSRSAGRGSPKKKFGLVLQGGGALGAYEVGAVEALYERGMECAIVAGTSSGAVNAVTLAGAKGYPPDALNAMWREFAVDPKLPLPDLVRRSWSVFGVPHMYRPRRDYWNALTWTYLADNTPLKEMLGRLDWDQVRDPEHMRLFVSATGVEDGERAYFGNTDGKRLTVEHVLASASVPGGFPWVVIEDPAFWGGDLADKTPLKPLIDHVTKTEAETMPIYMIDVNGGAAPKPANLAEVWLRMHEIVLQNNLNTDIKRARSYGRFIRVLKEIEEEGYIPGDAEIRKRDDWKKVMEYANVRNLHVISLKKPAGDSPSDFSRDSIMHRIRDGNRQTAGWLIHDTA